MTQDQKIVATGAAVGVTGMLALLLVLTSQIDGLSAGAEAGGTALAPLFAELAAG